jgi:hypothetical protein
MLKCYFSRISRICFSLLFVFFCIFLYFLFSLLPKKRYSAVHKHCPTETPIDSCRRTPAARAPPWLDRWGTSLLAHLSLFTVCSLLCFFNLSLLSIFLIFIIYFLFNFYYLFKILPFLTATLRGNILPLVPQGGSIPLLTTPAGLRMLLLPFNIFFLKICELTLLFSFFFPFFFKVEMRRLEDHSTPRSDRWPP